MKRIALFCLMAVACCLGIKAAKVDKSVDITVGDETRSYWLYVPSSYRSGNPLVVSLHGASGHSTDRSPFRTDIADKAGCIVVYPQGKDIEFPVFGGTVPGWDASGEVNEDVAFIKAIIEDVDRKYSIDRKRIYCCGFSNGGMMTYAMSNTCSDVFAAFASISGFPLNEFHLRHVGARPVPFLHIHGKQDDFVRYRFMPIIVDEMVARIGANPVPVKTNVSGKYDKSVYEAGEGSFPYIYYEIDGMGHNDFTGNIETGSSAQVMWNFFKKYTLDSPCDTTLKWRPQLDAEGYVPKEHGWTVNSSRTLLRFGGDQKTDANQNVYRSLQLTTGNYKLCFHAEGEGGVTVSVRLQKLTGKKSVILNATVPVGKDIALPFAVSDGWGEYRLTLTRPTTTDVIAITDLGLYSATEEEVTAVHSMGDESWTEHSSDGRSAYDLTGRPTMAEKGLMVVRTSDGKVQKYITKK